MANQNDVDKGIGGLRQFLHFFFTLILSDVKSSNLQNKGAAMFWFNSKNQRWHFRLSTAIYLNQWLWSTWNEIYVFYVHIHSVSFFHSTESELYSNKLWWNLNPILWSVKGNRLLFSYLNSLSHTILNSIHYTGPYIMCPTWFNTGCIHLC